MLQEDLQSALRQIDELKARNREREAKLLMAGTGNRDTMPTHQSLRSVWWSVTQYCATLEQNMQI